MCDRIANMRKLMVKSLGEVGSKLNWEHINHQTGMFGFTVFIFFYFMFFNNFVIN